jgi:hypothetical protein
MAYITCSTNPRYIPIETISDEDLHFLIDSEVQRVPSRCAVFILYDAGGAIYVGCGTLLNELPVAKAKHPTATRFSLRGLSLKDYRSVQQLAEMLKQEFGLQDQPTNKEPIGFRK